MFPEKCCYPVCFQCPYSDCVHEGIERDEIIRQDKFDKELLIVEPEVLRKRESQRKYEKSDKGVLRRIKYSKTQSFKENQQRYLNSEKGKEMKKRKAKKRIQNGKNAEYCRNYYLRKKYRMNQEQSIS